MRKEHKKLFKGLNMFLFTLLLASLFSSLTSFAVNGNIMNTIDSNDYSGTGGVATASNPTQFSVTNANQLTEALEASKAGDIILLENDIYLTETLQLSNSIVLQANKKTVIFSAEQQRHFVITGNEVSLSAENVTLDGNGISGGIHSTAENLKISGLIIQNCSATDLPNRDTYGGGIYAKAGFLTVTDCKIISNTAKGGGGIYGNTVIITNSRVEANRAENSGGIKTDDITVDDCEFISNQTTASNGSGGAITTIDGRINNSTLKGNYGANGGGGICIKSGGTTEISNSTFTENITKNFGAGIYGVDADSITISDCEFHKNSTLGLKETADATNGGAGVYVQGKYLTILNSKFTKNTANRGGGVFSRATQTQISDSVFLDNTADTQGGGIYNYVFPGDDVLIENCYIFGNYGYNGGGIYASLHGEDPDSADMVISNCEIINNSSGNGNGGGVYALRGLVEINNKSVIKDNFAGYAYLVKDEADMTLHNEMIDSSVTWTDGFDYIYNNLDVVYYRGERVQIYTVSVVKSGLTSETTEKFPIMAKKAFHYDFNIPANYEVNVEGDGELQVDYEAGTIDIASVAKNLTIYINYSPVETVSDHTIHVTVSYIDGAFRDQTTTYQVREGENFEASFEVQKGYELAGSSARTRDSMILVDGINRIIRIENVTRDYDIVVYLQAGTQVNEYTLTITVQYPDGTLEDEVFTYTIATGEAFEGSFRIDENHRASAIYMDVGMDVFFWNETVRIENIEKEMSAIIFCE